MGQILIGTCSWTERTLVESGHFYPEGVKGAEAMLRYYAECFPIVEVDSTYYAMPAQQTTGLWAERTPEGFVFNIKAFRIFTQHPTPIKALPRDLREGIAPASGRGSNVYLRDVPEEVLAELWRRFGEALLPLDSAGKLGVVLFQFPPWFLPSRESRDHVLRCQEHLPQYRIAVEFRTGSWLNERNAERTLRFLEENDLPFVAVDTPQSFRSSMPSVATATSDIAVVRFHGRNRETWEAKGIGAAERFRYLYSDEELLEWMPRIQDMSSQARQTHVLFNNCYSDFAVRNARDMARLLAGSEG